MAIGSGAPGDLDRGMKKAPVKPMKCLTGAV